MKYWILTTEYPPLFGGGISTYCYEAARMHTEQGDEVTVFIPDDKVVNYQLRETEGVRIITFNSNRSKLANYLGYIPRLSFEFAMIVKEQIEREGKPDFIEAQEYLAIAYYLLQFKKLLYPQFSGVPVILVLHSPAFLYLYYNREGIYEFPNYWTGEMEISCINAADQVIAPSAYIVDEIRKHISLDTVPVTVLRNPYHFETATQSAPAFTRNKIVFFGKLSPQKGVFELFEYFKALWDEGEKLVLHIVGGTEKVYYPEMKTMGQLIEQRYAGYIQQGLVTFRGKIAPSEKRKVLSDAHVVLIPSLNDNLPYAAIESMGLGKVVLASTQGGQAELITDKLNGYLFDHDVPGDFARKLKEVLALPDHRILTIGETAARGMRETLAYTNVYAAKAKLLTNMKSQDAAVGVRSAAADALVDADVNRVSSVFPFTRPLAVAAARVATAATGDLLSVVIPYFNMGAYIDDCVQSVLASSYQNIEIIIVNDGSTEVASKQALDRWKNEPRVNVITKHNNGLAHTRNHGASVAKGEFLAFLDADDKVTTDYYEKAIRVLSHYHNVSYAGSWVQYFGTKSDIWPTWNPEPPYILLHNSMNTSGLVYKTAAFMAAGINDKKVDYGLEDYGSIISLLSAGYRGVVLPEPLFHYRIRPDSMYRSLTRYKAMYSHQYLAQKYPELYRLYATDIFSLMNANGPSFAYDNPSFGIRVTSTVTGNSGLVNNLKMFVKRNPALKKILLQAKAVMKL